MYSHATFIGTLDIGTFQITGPGFGRTLVLAGTHTHVASAFSVNGTFQIMGPSKGSTQYTGGPNKCSTTVMHCARFSSFNAIHCHWMVNLIRQQTLASRGLEELFSSCAVVSVFGSGGK